MNTSNPHPHVTVAPVGPDDEQAAFYRNRGWHCFAVEIDHRARQDERHAFGAMRYRFALRDTRPAVREQRAADIAIILAEHFRKSPHAPELMSASVKVLF
jgi:hypothetical protein